jgi:hypothetical protein
VADTVKEVSVLVSDMEKFQDALNVAYYLSVSEDLVASYRKLDQNPQYSALTKQLEGALSKTKAYLESVQEAKEEEKV